MRTLEKPVLTAALAVAAAVVACLLASSASAAPAVATQESPGLGGLQHMAACKSPAKFPDKVGETFVTYCEICFDVGYKQIRKDYRMKATDKIQIAIIYGKRDEYGRYRNAATQGCIRGFALRKVP